MKSTLEPKSTFIVDVLFEEEPPGIEANSFAEIAEYMLMTLGLLLLAPLITYLFFSGIVMVLWVLIS